MIKKPNNNQELEIKQLVIKSLEIDVAQHGDTGDEVRPSVVHGILLGAHESVGRNERTGADTMMR
jgi:hypothetical protein